MVQGPCSWNVTSRSPREQRSVAHGVMMNRGLAETVVPSEQYLARLILDLQMLKSMVSDQ